MMVEGLPEYGAMVGPHCVQDEDGIPPEIPAWDQSVARAGAITLDHSFDDCPPAMMDVKDKTDTIRTATCRNERE